MPLLRIARARPAISAGVSPLARRSTKNAAVCAGSAASSSSWGAAGCVSAAAPLHQPTRGAARGRGSHRKRLLSALLRQVFAVQQELNHLRRHSRHRVLRCAHRRERSPRRTSRMLCLVAAAATTAAGVRPARGRGDDATRPCVARSARSCWQAVRSRRARCDNAPELSVVTQRCTRRLVAQRNGAAFAAQPCQAFCLRAVTSAAQRRALVGRPEQLRSGKEFDRKTRNYAFVPRTAES